MMVCLRMSLVKITGGARLERVRKSKASLVTTEIMATVHLMTKGAGNAPDDVGIEAVTHLLTRPVITEVGIIPGLKRKGKNPLGKRVEAENTRSTTSTEADNLLAGLMALRKSLGKPRRRNGSIEIETSTTSTQDHLCYHHGSDSYRKKVQ